MEDNIENILGTYSSGIDLPVEKQFELARFSSLIEGANREQAITMAKEIHRSLVVSNYINAQLLKHEWGLDK